MDLRTYLTARAMQGLLAGELVGAVPDTQPLVLDIPMLAKHSVIIADALIEELSKGK